jgi:hypothetical protein
MEKEILAISRARRRLGSTIEGLAHPLRRLDAEMMKDRIAGYRPEQREELRQQLLAIDRTVIDTGDRIDRLAAILAAGEPFTP